MFFQPHSIVFHLLLFLMLAAIPVYIRADLISGLENYLQIVKGEGDIKNLSPNEVKEVLEIHERLKSFGTNTAITDGCEAVIESQIDGEFSGWEGETIFKLINGQIWQQSSYSYTYHYAYMPEVIIYPSGGSCKLKVEDVDEAIFVYRLK
ncbi:MAG: hypothetical protein OXE42_11980 [Gammaproteobacteria bacterium]|nr:hypothetical protein [Gammaproteobacteria bacterium]